MQPVRALFLRTTDEYNCHYTSYLQKLKRLNHYLRPLFLYSLTTLPSSLTKNLIGPEVARNRNKLESAKRDQS